MSSSEPLNDKIQPDPTPYYKRIKTQDQIAREGFPKFRELAAELRVKVWENAMPPYGFFTALMLGREEPKPQQPPPPAPIVFHLVYRLEPVPRDQQGHELRMRLETMRAIQHTNSEAADEVQKAFPTTINCTGGKLRFNAEHDTLSLSDTQCRFSRYISRKFELYSQGTIVFADNWHKISRKMVFNNPRLWGPLRLLDYEPNVQFVEGFMEFLTDCAELRLFGFMYHKACHDSILENPDWELMNHEVIRFCYPGPIMKDCFYTNDGPNVSVGGLKSFKASFQNFEPLVHGPSSDQGLPSHLQGVRFGRPELQHLHFQAFVPAGPAVHDRMKSTHAVASEG